MSGHEEGEAWLEEADGTRHSIRRACSLGRAAENDIVLGSPKVSRRHALIHFQNIGECWLIDFGSSNGTFINKRRIHYPIRLNDGDQITIGDQVFGFRQPQEISEEYRTLVTQRTLHQVENVPCWLPVADICNFTPLSRSMESAGLDVLLGTWLSSCKEIIERRHGMINKYLGDGFLAYWPEDATTEEEIASAVIAFKNLQEKNAPDFRMVVHFGSVAIGGIASMGEESLMGKEVNLIFRLEKLASSLGERCGLSGPAQARLANLISSCPLGEHALKGFEEKAPFFAA